jgi:hypothetical protein
VVAKNVGAPRKEEEEQVESTVKHIRFPMALWKKLQKLAQEEDVTTLDYVRLVLRDHVRDREREARGE